LYDIPGNQEVITKTTIEITSHRMAGEPPPCLQCHHGRHSSTTSHHATAWPQDRDNNHAETCTTRRHRFQAKIARPSLRLMTPRSGEASSLCLRAVVSERKNESKCNFSIDDLRDLYRVKRRNGSCETPVCGRRYAATYGYTPIDVGFVRVGVDLT
jgi:hypothetical protein